jgi:predicted transcriptional regulator
MATKRKQKTKRTRFRREEGTYVQHLDRLIDDLFQRACDRGMTWSEFAREAGVEYSTVKKLGMRQTGYPQYRSLHRLAQSVGGRLHFSEGMKTAGRIRVTWTPQKLAGRHKVIKSSRQREAA